MGGETKTTTEFNLPEWQEDYLKGLSSFGSDLMSKPVAAYDGPMTAPLSALHGESADLYRRMAEDPDIAGRTATNFGAWRDAVLDPNLRALSRSYAQQEMGHEADLIRRGAFGGGRRDVYEGERAGAFDAQTAGLVAQGYSQAQANALAQYQAEQAGLGASAGGLSQQGAQETQLAQANLAMPYQEFARQQQMPLATFGALSGMPTGYQLGGSAVERQPYDWFGAVTAGAQAFAPFI